MISRIRSKKLNLMESEEEKKLKGEMNKEKKYELQRKETNEEENWQRLKNDKL